MADYTSIDPNTLLPGEPWTSAKALAAFENPDAIAEATAGAPVARAGWHPYNSTISGTGDGLLYSFARDGGASSVTSPDFADGYEYRFILMAIKITLTTGNATIDLKRASDNLFPSGAQDPIFAIGSASEFYGAVITLPLCRVTNRYPVVLSPLTQPTTGVQFDLGAATKVQGARFNFPSALTSGLIYMQRRRDYTT
jgi:hypothetical protein